jgi:hypothetical protein
MFAIGVCACTTRATTTQISLGPVQTATLQIGRPDTLGDTLDLSTGSVAPMGQGDFQVARDRTFLVGEAGPVGTAVGTDVGQVASLNDAPLPPATFANVTSPAVIGDAFVVRSRFGCPGVVRLTGELRGDALDPFTGATVPNAYAGATVEYAIADCHTLTIQLVEHTQGSCPFGQFMGGAQQVKATFDPWPGINVDASAPATHTLQIPHDFEVTLDEPDPTTWSGACSGSGPCRLVMSKDETVTATIDVPLRCSPGP